MLVLLFIIINKQNNIFLIQVIHTQNFCNSTDGLTLTLLLYFLITIQVILVRLTGLTCFITMTMKIITYNKMAFSSDIVVAPLAIFKLN